MLQSHEGLQQATVLVCKLLAVRVLLNFTLTAQSLPTAALEREDLVAEEGGFLSGPVLVHHSLMVMMPVLHTRRSHSTATTSTRSPRLLHHHALLAGMPSRLLLAHHHIMIM